MNLAKKRRLMYQELETVISYVENRKNLIDKRIDKQMYEEKYANKLDDLTVQSTTLTTIISILEGSISGDFTNKR